MDDPELVILCPQPLARPTLESLFAKHATARAAVVDFQADADLSPPADSWEVWRSVDLVDEDALRDDFLSFLDAWPRRPIVGEQSFDDLFRHIDGYSVWWVGPGSSRQPTTGPLFPTLRTLWICVRAIERARPRRVILNTRDRRLAAMVKSYCSRNGLRLELTPQSASPSGSPFAGQNLWLAGALAGLLLMPLWIIVRWLYARATAGQPREAESVRSKPAIVMTGWFPQHVRESQGQSAVWYWRELAERFEQAHGLRARYLLHTNRFRLSGRWKPLSLVYVPWRRLRRIEGVVPLQQSFLSLAAYVRFIPRQLAALARYRQLERAPAFRQSFEFAGADAASLMIPALRSALAGMAKWARNVDAIARSIAAVGNVRTVLVHEELYQKGMLSIAAARRLGIVTVGVQHGTLGPAHLVYTIPPGHIEGAPIPDYFSVYGEFAKEVISGLGAYPAERVWISGGPRFDHLTRGTVEPSVARARLELPREKTVVLVTTERYSWSWKSCAAVFTAAREWGDVVVCLKTHPGDVALERYAELAEKCGAANVRVFRDRFDDLLAACDVLVSGSSTTLLEAMLCGKSTICANFRDEPDRYPYVAEGGSLGAQTLADMRLALAQVRDRSTSATLSLARQRFLERHLGPTAQGAGAATLAEQVVRHVLAEPPPLRRAS